MWSIVFVRSWKCGLSLLLTISLSELKLKYTDSKNNSKQQVCQVCAEQDRQNAVNIQELSRNHFCSGKAISVTYSKCVFGALCVQHAIRMRHIAICGLSASTSFFHMSHKRHDFRKHILLIIKCVFWFSIQLLSETFLILWRTKRDVIKNVYWYSCKAPVFI